MLKKDVIKSLIVTVLLLALLVSGQSALLAQEPFFRGTTLTISASAAPYAYAFRKFEKEILQKFGVKMKFDMTPPADIYSKDMLQFASGSSASDIVLFFGSDLADYSKHLEPLQSMIEKWSDLDFHLDDILPIYRDIYASWGGTLYAIPWTGAQHVLYYNKDVFARYGLTPSVTWDDYGMIADKLNGKDWDNDGKKEYGVVEAWGRGGYAYYWWMNRFVAYGGVYFDENLEPLLNKANGLRALQKMLEVVPYVPPGTLTFGYPECEASFIKSQAPMVVQWPSTGKAAMDPTQSEIVGKVGVTVIPGAVIEGKLHRLTTIPTAWNAGIPKYSRHKKAAAYILEYISRPENALEIVLDPGTVVNPWRISSYDLSKWLEVYPGNEDYAREWIEALLETMELGVVDLQIPGSDAYIKAADAEISAALAGEKSPEEALDDAVKAWNEITEARGRETQKEQWNMQYDAMKKKGISWVPLK